MDVDTPPRLPEKESSPRHASYSPLSPVPISQSNSPSDIPPLPITTNGTANKPSSPVSPLRTKSNIGLEIPIVDLTADSSGAPSPSNTPPRPPPITLPSILLPSLPLKSEAPPTPSVIPPTPLKPEDASNPLAAGDAAAASDVEMSGAEKAGPKAKKPRKQRGAAASPPPALPPPPPPLPTIRLDIALGGPSAYMVNVLELARESGQRNPTPPPVVHSDDSSSSESEEDVKDKGKLGVGPRGKGKSVKKTHQSRYYDLDDPFIDDSELIIDEPKYMGMTKQAGFYVSSGSVALKQDTTKKRATKPKVNILGREGSAQPRQPSVVSSGPGIPPIMTPSKDPTMRGALSPTQEEGKGKKRPLDSSMATIQDEGAAKKRKTLVAVDPFSPELDSMLEELRESVERESFEQKGKFPQNLKPTLERVSLFALKNGEYGDNYFNVMPKIFPYNRYTMMKLIKKMMYADHQKLLADKTEELLVLLKKEVDLQRPKAEAEYEAALKVYDEHQVAKVAGGGAAAPATGTAPAATSGSPNAMQVDGRPATPEPNTSGVTEWQREEKPPQKRYRWTEKMKELLWQLVELSNASAQLTNEKAQFDGSTSNVSEQGLRKDLYKRIVQCFPDGWMQSTNISREVSMLKKKYTKETERDDLEE
ncbi:hypothetical protein CALVIDRAFT_568079 [Calocera viscosa TUFC12733]|uniref:Ubinuclein middle domain-containing protein n=1 Tax=Calocera viscosa (strain TUFC12733) TaxID=1330018 RepID=A0A167HHF3_CALVF|nr:hypothetical protein CALVIDRAFT_568079 [Calocera viscosa TUFC12733]